MKNWLAEVVKSGLALDLLEYHTKPLGIADQHTPAELREHYSHRLDVLDTLVQECKTHYLLADVPPPASPGTTRLPHDTLALVVRAAFDSSPNDGQRARRLLENRASGWKDGKTGDPLDRVDLAVVEKGLPGMRALEKDELALLEASRRKRLKQKLVGASVVGLFVLVVLGFLIVNYRQRKKAETNYQVALDTIETMKKGVADRIKPIAGIKSEAVAQILDKVVASIDSLAKRAGDSPRAGNQGEHPYLVLRYLHRIREHGLGPQGRAGGERHLQASGCVGAGQHPMAGGAGHRLR